MELFLAMVVFVIGGLSATLVAKFVIEKTPERSFVVATLFAITLLLVAVGATQSELDYRKARDLSKAYHRGIDSIRAENTKNLYIPKECIYVTDIVDDEIDTVIATISGNDTMYYRLRIIPDAN